MTKLEMEGGVYGGTRERPSGWWVNKALALLADRKCQHVILDTDRGFIQAKWCEDDNGAARDLLVELRLNMSDDYFEHYSLQELNGSYFHHVERAVPLFLRFLANERMPAGMTWVNVKSVIYDQ